MFSQHKDMVRNSKFGEYSYIFEIKSIKLYAWQAGLWLKPNAASWLKPKIPQADISNKNFGSTSEIFGWLPVTRLKNRETTWDLRNINSMPPIVTVIL